MGKRGTSVELNWILTLSLEIGKLVVDLAQLAIVVIEALLGHHQMSSSIELSWEDSDSNRG